MAATKAVPVKLDRKRSLRYSTAAFMAIEKELDINVLEEGVLEGILRNARLGDVVVLLWAGLVHEDRDLTVDDVADALELSRIEDYTGPMGEALEAAFPEEKKNGSGSKKKKKPSK